MIPHIFEPCSDLSAFVMCHWTLESAKENTPVKNTIVPDGTMKLIFHYADTYWHHPPHGNKTLLPHCFLIGQLTRPYVVEPLGITGTFVTRFHPEGFLPFTTLPIKDMENTAVPLSTLFGKEGEELGDSILQARDTAARIQHIETFLLAKLTKQTAVDNIIKSAVETILRAKGQFSIQEHSQHTQINRRQLTRKFSSAIGLSPKQLSKTIRLQATLKKLLNGEVKNFTELALENEYYDQAHFIKDFKEFTGLTPKEFYGDHLKMSLIFDSPQ